MLCEGSDLLTGLIGRRLVVANDNEKYGQGRKACIADVSERQRCLCSRRQVGGTVFERMLKRPETPSEVLLGLSPEELNRRAEELQMQMANQR